MIVDILYYAKITIKNIVFRRNKPWSMFKADVSYTSVRESIVHNIILKIMG